MKTRIVVLTASALMFAQGGLAEPSLTIYNQNFAVVRDTVPLDLKPGVNEIRFTETTAQLEPDSVILRDPSGKVGLRVLEQNYRNDPVSQELLLSLFEGKTISFLAPTQEEPDRRLLGTVIRSGYANQRQQEARRYDPWGTARGNPIINVGGEIRFGLPGTPVFPSLGDDTILKPALTWLLEAGSPDPVKLDAELAYVSGGMTWKADYNVIVEENGNEVELIGWVTIDNQSGKTFERASIKLMAGDVSKIQPETESLRRGARGLVASDAFTTFSEPQFKEKAFDEYHLYTLQRPSTVRDRETKQVEFARAASVQSQKVYVYDGVQVDWNRWDRHDNIRWHEAFGAQSHTKVSVFREFKNSEANRLGIPLPKGRMRFYMRDGQQLEFTGENEIDHTPKDELVKVYTGNAFDLSAERGRTDYKMDSNQKWVDETFEIKLRNHKKDAVEIRVVEHLYRWSNWEIMEKSDAFIKSNAQEIQFRVTLKPDEERTVTYKVHYSW